MESDYTDCLILIAAVNDHGTPGEAIRFQRGIPIYITLPLLRQGAGQTVIWLPGIGHRALAIDQNVDLLCPTIISPENPVETLSSLIGEIGGHKKLHFPQVTRTFLHTQDVRSQVLDNLSHTLTERVHISYCIMRLASRIIPLSKSNPLMTDEPIVHPFDVPTHDSH